MQNSQMPSFSNVKSLLQHFVRVSEDIGTQIPSVPQNGSFGDREFSDTRYKSHIVNAITNANVLTRVCSDYLAAGDRLLTLTNFLPYAFAANARASMETAARCKWLMSPDCDAKTRCERSLLARFDNSKQEAKVIRSMTTSETIDDALDFRQKEIVNQGGELGITLKKWELPPATALIKEMLGKESIYRFLSGVAHVHLYAIKELGIANPQMNNSDPDEHGFLHVSEKVNSRLVAISAITLVECFVTCVWYNAKYRLACTLRIEEQIDNGFDLIRYVDSHRFWRCRSNES